MKTHLDTRFRVPTATRLQTERGLSPSYRQPFPSTCTAIRPRAMTPSGNVSLQCETFPGPDYVFLGVGSDEVIDLLMRVFVAPGREKILTTPPTYGMYAVCAQVNDAAVVRVPLELSGERGEGGERGRFSLKVDEV